MYQVKVEDDYSIIIPEEIVNKLKLKEGDRLEITVEDGTIVISPIKIRVSAEEFENNFDKYFDSIVKDNKLFFVEVNGKEVVMLSETMYNSIKEAIQPKIRENPFGGMPDHEG